MIYQTGSTRETQMLARKLARTYKSGGTIALIGNLGAGKTTFVQGFAKGLGIKDKILSPTFVLVREYPLPNNKFGKFYHIDLYRLDKQSEIDALGFDGLFANSNNIILIEWAEKLKNLPSKAVSINFRHLSETDREIMTKD